MRISKVLEDDDRNGETKKFIHPENKRGLRFRLIKEHYSEFDETDELKEQLKICKYLYSNINEVMIITSDDCDDHDDLVEITNRIYARGEFDNPPFTFDGDVEVNRIVKLDGFRVVISQSSPDFIKITFRTSDINKLVRQILVR